MPHRLTSNRPAVLVLAGFFIVVALGVALTLVVGRAYEVWDGQLDQLREQGELFKENQVLRCLELQAEGVPADLCVRILADAEVGG